MMNIVLQIANFKLDKNTKTLFYENINSSSLFNLQFEICNCQFAIEKMYA